MLRQMLPVVQHKSPELPSSDGSVPALPLLLKLPGLPDETTKRGGTATSTLYQGTACNTAQNGYAVVLLPSK